MGSQRSVRIGELEIGGGRPVRVESMLKNRVWDVKACVEETLALKEAGCELARVALPDEESAGFFAKVALESAIPLMADIHFSHKLALAAIRAGAKAIRINPGNMRGGIAEVVSAAKGEGVVIRIGANGGSLNNAQLEKCAGDRGAALVAAVEEQLQTLLDNNFDDIILSAKSSSVAETVRANAILSSRYPFPFHIGITEAGCGASGIAKGSVGIGLMLSQGVGDAVRVSLTASGVEETETAYAILAALSLRFRGWSLVSCPACGRRRVEVKNLVERLRALVPPTFGNGMTIAVMGCEVNGPKEASSADLGVAGTAGGFILFKKGKFVCKGSSEHFEDIISRELNLH